MAKLKALFLNTSLKTSNEDSNTDALYGEVERIYENEGVVSETVRVADYNIPVGISDDLGGEDEWPTILKKVKEADIVIIGTPIWLGEKSSLATVTMERLYGGSGLTNEKGQSIYYNKVGGVVVTGNEDGAKNAATSLIYGLSHIGFLIPPNVDTYWVGEAGPGPSFMEANGKENEFTQNHVKMLAYNTIHIAKLLKENPIPAEGNVME
ncbi:flavodoxin family protein [Oceanobacillus kimchii]|uniref:8-demethyl-8-aminoriboflavin-5'-phosphate (AFP) synthase RosB n=1 Tax=Oceanobacillus kimchii TaxID=746691 RepID=A0ABQ5TRJ3_9BACI|nr:MULTISPECIES: flavodoxin family protein [Oceanobacillus]MBT2599701.1 flavodoxin family protein [Oceanobacillus sp. ISL-74]MCT1576897.1 flavodoxin family protein [Oceanobacillus kimchii]MCT2134967.1 flavodoxin family protein [Oceanobacillus kimchii]OEH56247.1 BRAMP protein [Oceanobacillus sp. E9]GLO67930.1 8-demethyl-8-aminoriboflavin-5'-phosphate (AFP) synthase RosB [Oceanobacillus kimchii]